MYVHPSLNVILVLIIMQILMSVLFQILMVVLVLIVTTHWAVLCASVILDLYLMVKIIALVMHGILFLARGCFSDCIIAIDINECATDTDNCDINADCTNTEGSFTCTCHSLYYGDGYSCSRKSSLNVSNPCQRL